MSLYGHNAKGFSQEEIQNAIDSSRSFREAARYLNASYNTFKKYAKLYDLWIVGGKNPAAKGIPKAKASRKKRSIDTILNGSRNGKNLNLTKLREWIIREIKLPEKCDMCNYSEKRIVDFKVPLILTFNNGDRQDYRLENLRLLCWNCSFLTQGNVIGRKKEYYSDTSGEVYQQIDWNIK